MYLPTTKVTVLGIETEDDEFGDPKDTYKAVRQDIPAHIWEDSKLIFVPVDSRVQTVRTLKALVSDSETLIKGERLRDQNTDQIYIITHVKIQASPLGANLPQQIELSLVV